MKKIKLKGKEGWLGLFGALFLISIFMNAFSSLIFLFDIPFFGIISFVVVAYSVFIFTFYLKEKKDFIKNIKIYLWIGILLNIIEYYLPFDINSGEIYSIIFSVCWLIYFYKSKRVKNTFVK